MLICTKHVSDTLPWMLPEVIDWLAAILQPDWTVLETGAGGSTVFFACRVARVISYEHIAHWAHRVEGIPNVHVRFWPDYPTEGLGLLSLVDLACIDGRGRVRSVLDALPKIKPRGWLLLDDSDRPRYREAHEAAEKVSSARIVFRSGPDETTAWRIG
jgi:hypothetical protein